MRVLLFNTDKTLQSVMSVIMEEAGLTVDPTLRDGAALQYVRAVKYDMMFLEFWNTTEAIVYNLVLEYRKTWKAHPSVVLMQQTPIPRRTFHVLDNYQVMNLPFDYETLLRVIK